MAAFTAPALSPAQIARLEAEANYPTRYEMAVIRNDGAKALVCYSAAKSRRAMLAAAQTRGQAILAFLRAGDDSQIKMGKGEIVLTGCGVIRFTGRTKRDVIMADDEMPFVGDAA